MDPPLRWLGDLMRPFPWGTMRHMANLDPGEQIESQLKCLMKQQGTQENVCRQHTKTHYLTGCSRSGVQEGNNEARGTSSEASDYSERQGACLIANRPGNS